MVSVLLGSPCGLTRIMLCSHMAPQRKMADSREERDLNSQTVSWLTYVWAVSGSCEYIDTYAIR